MLPTENVREQVLRCSFDVKVDVNILGIEFSCLGVDNMLDGCGTAGLCCLSKGDVARLELRYVALAKEQSREVLAHDRVEVT
jgi:hypothetical protein